MKGNSFVITAAFAAVIFSSSLFAQSSASLEQRIAQLEQQNQTSNQLQSEMSMQLIELQKEVKDLRGIIEEHDYKLNQIQDRQRDLYRDIENRLSGLSTNTRPASSTNSTPVKTQPVKTISPNVGKNVAQVVSGDERGAFEAAFNKVRNRDYDQAIGAFEAFLKEYPQGSFSDNARFWIGQVYFAQSKLVDAEKQFNQLRSDYPDSTKMSAAMLKLAEIKVRQQDWTAAKTLYNEIVAKYDGAQQQLARKGLLDIKQAGH